MARQKIIIPPVDLTWGQWVAWGEIASGSVRPPRGKPGVYEVKRADKDARLTIGKAADLRRRVARGLVKGQTPHSAGQRIRELEDVSTLVVRWAVTDRPAAVEEELHRRHRRRFGGLPEYTQHT